MDERFIIGVYPVRLMDGLGVLPYRFIISRPISVKI